MEFLELSELEFKDFSSIHPYSSFYQTCNWGHLKEKNGWKMYIVGIKNNNDVIAATLVLGKTIPIIKKKMFYAPRGFLLDYNNYDLLKLFTKEIKNFIKQKNGIFLKIDPYISYQERDINGKIVESKNNNKNSFNNLKKLKYRHFGFNLMQDTLQPRWIFTTNTKNTTVDEIMKNMDPKTRQILRKNEKMCIKTREIGYDELDKFKDIMKHTGDRRDFIDRPLSYYQNMYTYLEKDKIIKILLAELDTILLLKELKKELKQYNLEYNTRLNSYENQTIKMNETKYLNKQKESKNNILRIENKIKEVECLKNKYGDIITLGGILFLIYGNEVLSLVGGSYKSFMEYQSAYTIHWEGMKLAIKNDYKRYNFYGITGIFDEKNPLYGLYLFKKGFGGQVVELLGEFDLIINKPLYYTYKCVFYIYKNSKNIIKKIGLFK